MPKVRNADTSGTQTGFYRNTSIGISGTNSPNKTVGTGWQTPAEANPRILDVEGMIERDEQGRAKVSAGRNFFRKLMSMFGKDNEDPSEAAGSRSKTAEKFGVAFGKSLISLIGNVNPEYYKRYFFWNRIF